VEFHLEKRRLLPVYVCGDGLDVLVRGGFRNKNECGFEGVVFDGGEDNPKESPGVKEEEGKNGTKGSLVLLG